MIYEYKGRDKNGDRYDVSYDAQKKEATVFRGGEHVDDVRLFFENGLNTIRIQRGTEKIIVEYICSSN